MPRRAAPIKLRAVTGANPIYASPSEAIGANTRLIAELISSGRRLLQAEKEQAQHMATSKPVRNGVTNGR